MSLGLIILGYKMNVFILALELLCYSGNFLSGIIARNIYRMTHKTKINKMFLGYFIIDCVIGLINTFFLFKLYRERLEKHEVISICICICIVLADCSAQSWSGYQTEISTFKWRFHPTLEAKKSIYILFKIWWWRGTGAKLSLFLVQLVNLGTAETAV